MLKGDLIVRKVAIGSDAGFRLYRESIESDLTPLILIFVHTAHNSVTITRSVKCKEYGH
jgi:hypothetical protein